MKKLLVLFIFIFVVSCGNAEIENQETQENPDIENTQENISNQEIEAQKTQNENQEEIVDTLDNIIDLVTDEANKWDKKELEIVEDNEKNTENIEDNSKEDITQETNNLENEQPKEQEQKVDIELEKNNENQSENKNNQEIIEEKTQNTTFEFLEEISQDYLQKSDFEVSQEGYLKKNVYTIWKYKFPEDDYTHKIKKSICVSEMCFLVWTPVKIKNNGIIFTPTFDYDAVWYNPNNENYYKTSQSDWPDVTIVNRHLTFDNTLVESTISSSCWGTNYKQTANGKLSKLPEVISYGNVDFYLQDLNFTGKYYMMNNDGIWRLGYTQDLISQNKNSNTVTFKNVEEKLAEQVEKKNKLQTTYYVNFLDYPGVVLPYTTQKELSFGVYQSDENIANGNVKNIEIAKKIHEKLANYYVLSHEVNGTIPEPSDEILTQIFRVEKVKDDKYLVYLNTPYSLQSMAEMCKPLVYIYGKDTENMSLKLNTIKDWEFTKLIPEFQEKNTWNFSTKNNKVHFGNQSYDYLYYAIKVPEYTHNQNGWIIEWSQAEEFFEDKLDYIWFNNQEKKDFIEYWKSKYEKNKYYFISFKFNTQLDKFVKLEFSHTPDSIFRVLLDSYEIIDKNAIASEFWYENTWEKFDRQLLEKYSRSWKFDVFEWGGVLQTFDKKYIK